MDGREPRDPSRPIRSYDPMSLFLCSHSKPDRLPQRIELFLPEQTRLSRPHSLEREGTQPHSLKRDDRVANRLAHEPDLSFPALVDRDAQHRVLAPPVRVSDPHL